MASGKTDRFQPGLVRTLRIADKTPRPLACAPAAGKIFRSPPTKVPKRGVLVFGSGTVGPGLLLAGILVRLVSREAAPRYPGRSDLQEARFNTTAKDLRLSPRPSRHARNLEYDRLIQVWHATISWRFLSSDFVMLFKPIKLLGPWSGSRQRGANKIPNRPSCVTFALLGTINANAMTQSENAMTQSEVQTL